MKISISYLMVVTAVLAVLALGGCGSSQDASTGAPAQPATSSKSIPPQVQAKVGQQEQQKKQLDDMREKDAKKAQ